MIQWQGGLPRFPDQDLQSLRAWIDHSFRSFSRDHGARIEAWAEPMLWFLRQFEFILQHTPAVIVVIGIALLQWRATRRPVLPLGSVAALLTIHSLGLWPETMSTLAIVITATVICVCVGIPWGIACTRSPITSRISRGILDTMQTIPAFVYLIPIIMLLGIGRVPGLIAVAVYALPPMVRLTELGIRSVPQPQVEAGRALGLGSRHILWLIELPLARSALLTGINQCVMLGLSMIVIAAMIGANGLGLPILRAIANQHLGLGLLAGLAIVAVAVIADRTARALADRTRY